MKATVIVLTFFLMSCGGSNEQGGEKENKNEDKFEISKLEKAQNCDKIEGRQLAEGEEFPENYTGFIKQCYPSGMLHRIGYFEKSQQEGAARSYYESGNLKVDALWKEGKLNGLTTAYYDNGKVQSTLTYKDNLKHGEQIVFYENGELQSKAKFVNGELNGEYITYHENGQMKLRVPVVNGKPVKEESEFWDEEGNKVEGNIKR
ncbi:MAG: toxin-antitoxin system YwqK family antitoxin [Crocinitomicaceae bacterium]|nr:toxin-antitoxin system YwqK family antitoxin [Crocinitomicaceae bacterium]